MDGVRIINYSNIFLSCFMDDASSHSDMVKEHYMGYVYAGEIVINEKASFADFEAQFGGNWFNH